MKVQNNGLDRLVIINNKYFAYIMGYILGAIGIIIFLSQLIAGEFSSLWFGLILVAIGGFLIAFTKKTKITIDKTNNKIFISKKSKIKKNYEEYPLSALTSVDLIFAYDRSSGSRGYGTGLSILSAGLSRYNNNNYQYHLGLMLNKSQEIRISSDSTMTTGYISNGQKIAIFAGVPFNEKRPPGLGDMVNVIKDTVGGILGNKDSSKE